MNTKFIKTLKNASSNNDTTPKAQVLTAPVIANTAEIKHLDVMSSQKRQQIQNSQDVYSSDIDSVMNSQARGLFRNIKQRVDSIYEMDNGSQMGSKNRFAMRRRQQSKEEHDVKMQIRKINSSKRFKEDLIQQGRSFVMSSSNSMGSRSQSDSISVSSDKISVVNRSAVKIKPTLQK